MKNFGQTLQNTNLNKSVPHEPATDSTLRTQITPAKESAPVEIRVARSFPEISGLRTAWSAWGGHRDSDFDFVSMIVESYPEAVRPHVIAVYRNGSPEAVLIGRLENKPLTFKIGYFSIFRASARSLTFVYGALRGNASAENTSLLVREVLAALKRDEADIALFEFVPTESPLFKLALDLPGPLSRDTFPARQEHHVMTVPESIEAVYQQMSGSRRKHLRSSIKKLELHPVGVPRIVCFRDVLELDRLFHDAEEIARKTYQRGLGAGFADSPDVRQRLDLAARKGWLRAYLLYLGDRPVAFWIGMLYQETFVSEYMGYDPEFRQSAPGMVLIMRVVEGFCSHKFGDNVKELDFGLGHAEYKALLCTRSWVESAVFVFSPTSKGLLLKSMRAITRIVDLTARRVLSSRNVFPRLKKLWRNWLAKQAKSTSAAKAPD